MPLLIGEEQSSFVPGRQIIDNIVIVQEVIHFMKMQRGKKNIMAIKVDLEKAYNRIRQEFIQETLIMAGLPKLLIGLIMHVTTTSMQVLWNGEASNALQSSRGIFQGDPLSLYLFVLCMERLAHLIKDCVDSKMWKPFQISKNGPNLSHVFFTDGLVLFVEGTQEQMNIIQNCLTTFYKASGAKVSVPKTKIMFSNKTLINVRRSICALRSFEEVSSLRKYIGVPLFTGRVTKTSYAYITDHTQKKLSGQKSKS